MKDGRNYRDPLTIMAMILDATMGISKTHVMYRARLSHAMLENYLEKLLALGFLQYDQKTRLYSRTPRGTTFLKSFSDLLDVIKEMEGKQLAVVNLLQQKVQA